MNRLITLLAISLLLFGCRSGGERKAGGEFEVPEDVVNEGVLEISEEVMQISQMQRLSN